MVGRSWPGVRPEFSRYLTVPSTAGCDLPDTSHRWHVLDNGPILESKGASPAGTILAVHGNPTWSYLWRSVVEAATVAETPWRVIAVDQLDMGFSERTGTFRRLDDRVTDLGDLTDALGLSGPIVTLGHDWGGVISLGWATRHRDLLAGVVLTNTAVHPAGFKLPPALSLALNPAVHRWGTQTTPAFLKVTHSLAHPPLSAPVKAAFMEPYLTAAQRAGVANFVADIPAEPGHPSWPALETISADIRSLRVPTLMMWGPRDPIFSDRYLRDLMDRLPQASVHRFEFAGHLLPEDRDIATPLLAWLTASLPSEDNDRPTTPPAEATQPFRSMLSELDARRDDQTDAVVDMLPSDGSTRLSRAVSWSSLARRVDAIATGLAELGVRRGDRVNLLVPPSSELTALVYACLRLGAVIVVADAGLGTRGLGRAIRGAGPGYLIGIERALIGARALNWPGQRIAVGDLSPAKHHLLGVTTTVPDLERAGTRALAHNASPFETNDPDADAAVLFTSGSTGPAKGVVYTHRQLAAMRDTLQETYGLKPGDALVAGFAPFALLGPALGAVSVTPDMDVTSPRTLTASALADAAAAIDATIVFASPAALVNVLATADDMDSVQRAALEGVNLLLSAGAPLGAGLLQRVQRLAPQAAVHTPYGMTEALPVTDISLTGIIEAGVGDGVCVGTPVAGAQVRIAPLAADGSVTDALSESPGVLGEIVVAAPHVKDRYDRLWITEQASSQHPGWHHTGDVGQLDAEGRLWVQGRLGHIITTPDGVRTPVAAELAAESVDAIRRAAVVGVGPAGTQAVVVIVETDPRSRRPGLLDQETTHSVRSAVLQRTGIKVSAVLSIPDMPTDIRHNSKIDRSALSEWAGSVLSGQKGSLP
ncbi:alpha/beta fold hydrolase [Arthrobacter sp.]|uniref:alpha/beta fold hydrolase n=1 Tax=Arthrobacter sp. TaxID=1667 RepID=UPI003A93599C